MTDTHDTRTEHGGLFSFASHSIEGLNGFVKGYTNTKRPPVSFSIVTNLEGAAWRDVARRGKGGAADTMRVWTGLVIVETARLCYTMVMMQHTPSSHDEDDQAPGSARGGKARGDNARGRRSRDAYVADPHLCANPLCRQPILPHATERLVDTRKRRFCGRSCAASVNNQASIAPKRKAAIVPCADCGQPLDTEARAMHRRTCATCRAQETWRLGATPLGETSLALLKRHARFILSDRSPRCQCCDYDAHTEPTHLQAPDSFDPSTPLHLINTPANLVYLCLNHAWEYTHGRLALSTDRGTADGAGMALHTAQSQRPMAPASPLPLPFRSLEDVAGQTAGIASHTTKRATPARLRVSSL